MSANDENITIAEKNGRRWNAALGAGTGALEYCGQCGGPGIIETSMTLSSIGKGRIDGLTADIPMGRIGTLDDISWAFAWLASAEANYMTGQVISPNGGATIVGI